MFNVVIGDTPSKLEPHEDGESANKLEDMIRELSGQLIFSVIF